MESLKKLEKSKNYPILISTIKEKVFKDKRILEDHYVKRWLGKRFRNIFIQEMTKDEKAIDVATQKKLIGVDERSVKEKLATRFLKEEGPDEWNLEMPEPSSVSVSKDLTLLFCPGLLSGLLPVMAFKEEFPIIEEEFGIRILQSDSHPVRSCDANSIDILNAIEKGKGLKSDATPVPKADELPTKDLIVLAYSKGMPDLLHTILKKPNIAKRIRCIVNWAGAPGGSYLANSLLGVLDGIQIGVSIPEEFGKVLHLLSPVIEIPEHIKRLAEYDIQGAVKDLNTHRRAEFLEEHSKFFRSLQIPVFNITGATTALEVPYYQLQGLLELNKYDANNDMQVIQRHSRFHSPLSVDLSVMHAHHWDMSYGQFPARLKFGSLNLDHPFPRLAALRAVLKFLGELGFLEKKRNVPVIKKKVISKKKR
ncbi:MAG: hypothetical protein SFU98_11515 [Leptospiraceae bacterium]|nr:hypothetical protein [Leptospiraceae bacterium]